MDMRLASTEARFGFVFARRGIVPEAASSWFLPRIVGISRALEWCETGRIFGADEALAGGLVRSVHEPDDLLPAAYALAAEIVENAAPVSVALTRQMLWRMAGADHPMEAHKVDSRAHRGARRLARRDRGRDGVPGEAPGAVPDDGQRRDAGLLPLVGRAGVLLMCRLFARVAAQPYPATFGLLEAPDSVEAQSRREPDGYGIGSFDKEGAPHVIKRAKAAYQDRAFPQEAHELRSRIFVAHIRFATNGENLERNTHPFTQHGRIFAHNGVVHGLDAVEARLRPEYRALVGGETDSERVFALITQEIDDRDGDVTGAHHRRRHVDRRERPAVRRQHPARDVRRAVGAALPARPTTCCGSTSARRRSPSTSTAGAGCASASTSPPRASPWRARRSAIPGAGRRCVRRAAARRRGPHADGHDGPRRSRPRSR